MNKEFSYTLIDNTLRVREENSKRVFWEGKPKDIPVEAVFSIHSSNDCIVLLNWRKASVLSTQNLLRCNPEGQIKWEVNIPPSKNEYLGIKRDSEIYVKIKDITETRVEAHTFSGFLDSIDIATGEVINSIFTK